MKITEYPKASTLADDDVLLVDGDLGTRNIQAKEAIMKMISLLSPKEFIGDLDLSKLESGGPANLSPDDRLLVGAEDGNKSIPFSEAFYDLVDDVTSLSGQGDLVTTWVLKRSLWRGKYLGNYVTDEQYASIKDGTFKRLFLGDYWVINEVVWRIVDFNYWLYTGKTSTRTFHLIIMPDRSFPDTVMNDTNTTVGAYIGSKMRTYTLPTVINPIIFSCFGESHILSHMEWLSNSVLNGYPATGAWTESTIEIPNEFMIFGGFVFTPSGTGQITVDRHTTSRLQLAGMQVNPWLINPEVKTYWLRDVVSSSNFADASLYGYTNNNMASQTRGVRPVFGLIG